MQKNDQNHITRISQIAKILANGIYRLQIKENSPNPEISVDNKALSSIDRIDSNFNQQYGL